MSKISQIKLNETLYNIDVAAELKSSTPTKDSTSVATSGAVYTEQEARKAADNLKLDKKPDGSVELIDPDSGKISSHYISDTILGQLKFGGVIKYHGFISNEYYMWSTKISKLLETKALELVSLPSNLVLYSWADAMCKLKLTPDGQYSFEIITYDTETGTIGQTTVTMGAADLEGFYFIVADSYVSQPDIGYEEDEVYEVVLPACKTGDWVLCCGESLQKIDNTDTITHIDETDGTSLLEITGSSGLKLNGIIVEESELVTEKTFTSRTSDSSQGSKVTPNGFSTFGGLASATYGPASIKIETSQGTTTITGNTVITEGTVSAPTLTGDTIQAFSKMTAPTISDTADKTQVVNLDYFENNATKVDWENIDSDVRVINGHNFKIQGKYTEQNIGCGILPSSFDSIEPQRDSSTGQWEWGVDESWTSPYWGYFEIKKNCRYIVKPAKTSGPFNNAECLDSGASVLVSAELSNTPLLELTSEDHDLIYQPSVFDEESWEPSFGGYIEFKAPIDGFAFFGTSDSFDPVLWVVLERVFEKEASAEIEGDLKVTGDIEITGDLSFGADSHLVFGTIEGTDFIADHAKVTSDPVEDTDVVNKAYLEAYIASLGGVGGSYPAAEDIAF